ncbi:hypothetical protein, partial [Thermoactinomyces daqus]|uniref:hypothetical protein n=1 Tax=Thermoactinomyces daqus TaxID=1329516 RepID=UPI001C690308
ISYRRLIIDVPLRNIMLIFILSWNLRIFTGHALVSYAATHSFVYDFNKSIRSRDFKFKGYHDLTLTFKSVTCRKNQTMKVEVKHNVSWGRDTTIARKNISECGGTIRHIGFDNKTPVYFIVTKNTKDKFWVQGTGKIHN